MVNYNLSILVSLALVLGLFRSGVGQGTCLRCKSITYLDTDFTNVDLLEDDDCILGKVNSDNVIDCPPGKECTTFDGTVTWFVKGYGFLDAQVTLRTCVGGVTFDEQENRCFDRHSSYNFMYQLIGKDFQDREMTNADGNLCGCNHTQNCNSQEGAMIDMKGGGHTPKPNVRGLQCLFCSHQVLHNPQFTHLDEPNPSCSEAEIQDGGVYYQTCAAGAVCGIIDGNVTYGDVTASYFIRDCLYDISDLPATEGTDGLLCLSGEDAQMVAISHLVADPNGVVQVTYDGEVCYCTSDLCELPRTNTKKTNLDNGCHFNTISFGRVVVWQLLLSIIIMYMYKL
ncbi:uncharacterized protein [Apostichopus japonicus]|uniref:uncharacterized protein isoform X2 n=1 Tax=Stichopus japonicus TaxID=307972 RepID=UPI003AB707F9